MTEPDWKALTYALAEDVTIAISRLRATADWSGNMYVVATGEMASWEELFARTLEKIPGYKVDRRVIDAKYLPAKQRRKAYAELRATIKRKGEAV